MGYYPLYFKMIFMKNLPAVVGTNRIRMNPTPLKPVFYQPLSRYFIVGCLLVSLAVLAQDATAQTDGLPQRATLRFTPEKLCKASLWPVEGGTPSYRATASGDIPQLAECPFLAYSITWYSNSWSEDTDRLTMFFKKHGSLSEPVPIHPDHHADVVSGRHISQLYFLENGAESFRFQFAGLAKVDSVVVHFFAPGHSRQAGPGQPPVANGQRAACTCPQPAFQGRLDWCPDGTCPTDPTPVGVPTVTHLIVHHSAGTNTASDWAAVVRSIWDFHVNVNGWDDVGYNWLVDPNGVLYEGRGDGILGAHFCGQNGSTMGVCVMGDFTGQTPTPDAIGILEELLTWKCCGADLNPLESAPHASSGLTLPRIAGHRDGCSTSCPGDSFYPLLPGVRNAVQGRIDNDCEPLELQAPTVLAVTYVLDTIVGLQWQDNASNEDSYILERSVGSNTNFELFAQLPANSVSHADGTVEPGNTYFYRVKAQTGATGSGYSNEAVVVTGVSDAAQLVGSGQLRIFPNPAHDQLRVETDGPALQELALSDAAGQAVLTMQPNTTAAELNVSNLPPGIYFLAITQADKTVWAKVFVRS